MSKSKGPSDPPDHFDVGYKKPPVSGRFQKGKSGNPSGRPKRIPTADSIMAEAIGWMVTLTVDGRRQRLPVTTAILRPLQNDALRGNIQAIREWNRLVEMYEARNPRRTEQEQATRVERRDMIMGLIQQLRDKAQDPYRRGGFALVDGQLVKIDRLVHFYELPPEMQRELEAEAAANDPNGGIKRSA